MTPSDNAFDMIKKFEGYSATAYPDPGTGGEPFTLGYGHTDRGKVKLGDVCDEPQADYWLRQDVQTAVDGVNRLVTVPLTQNQFDALVDFSYNVGLGNLERSTLLKKLNSGDYEGAANEFPRWNKANGKVMNGLTRRREAEKALFLS